MQPRAKEEEAPLLRVALPLRLHDDAAAARLRRCRNLLWGAARCAGGSSMCSKQLSGVNPPLHRGP